MRPGDWDRDRRLRRPELPAAGDAALDELHGAAASATPWWLARALVDEGREREVETNVGNGHGEQALHLRQHPQLHACVRAHGRESRDDEEVRNAALGRLDVEHAAAAGIDTVGGVVWAELAGGIGVALVPHCQRALAGYPPDLLVVRPAPVLRRFGLHVPLGAAGIAQALAELLAGCERSRVDLHLEVALVLVPVADLDREGQQQQKERHEQTDEGDHASVLPP